MLNKSHLKFLKSARKKKLLKSELYQNASTKESQLFAIHNLTNPMVNPLRLNFHLKQQSGRKQSLKSDKNLQRNKQSVMSRKNLQNTSLSRQHQKNKTVPSSDRDFGYKTISEKQLSKLKQMISKIKKNKREITNIFRFYSPNSQNNKMSLKTLTYQDKIRTRLSLSPPSKQTRKITERSLDFKLDLAKRRYVKVSQPKSILQNKVIGKLKDSKPKEQEQKNLRLTISGWVTKQEFQI